MLYLCVLLSVLCTSNVLEIEDCEGGGGGSGLLMCRVILYSGIYIIELAVP